MHKPKPKQLLIIIAIWLCSISGYAQTKHAINGLVTDNKGKPIIGATVFLNGTQKTGATDNKGEFGFKDLAPGAYVLIIKMLGYATVTNDVAIRDKDVDLKISMEGKAIELREIVVGGDEQRPFHYGLFKDNFLGQSNTAMECRILNPEALVLKMNNRTGLLTASSDDFLIIENKQLGYRIKYLLKKFEYNSGKKTTSYSGNTIFEDLPGTDKMKKRWAENRLKAYQGSLMHFFRSVYAGSNESLKAGFLTQSIVKQTANKYNDGLKFGVILTTIVDPRPVAFDTLANVFDDAFMSIRFKRGLAVTYDPKKAQAQLGATESAAGKTEKVTLGKRTSTLQLGDNELLVDSRGCITNLPAVLVNGSWGEMRIGDQLPYEYRP